VYVRAVLGFLRARAGHHGVANGRSGAVVIIQRFGGALNLNVHIHALVIDGVFAPDGRFQATPLTSRETKWRRS
jgi:Putative transposase